MTKRYHVNPTTGRAGACGSDPMNPRARGCAFKLSDDEHYESASEARAAFEAQNSASTFKSHGKAERKSASLATPWGEVRLSSAASEAIDEAMAQQERSIARAKRLVDAPMSLNEVLTPPIYAIRDRGVSVVKREDDEDLAYYGGDEPGPFIVISSRQGGGNNEYCYECDDDNGEDHACLIQNNEEMESHPQFVYATDDSFDSTYRYAYFTFDQERLDEYLGADRLRSVADRAEQFQSKLKEGKVSPWGFNGDYTARERELQGLLREQTSARENFESSKRDNELLANVNAKIDNLEELNEEEIEFAENVFYDRAKRWISKETISKEYNGLLESKRKVEIQQRMIEQAEILPEGSELRDHLLKDRGEGSYMTTKKVGRRNQQVRVTYQRGSLLGSDLQSAEAEHKGKLTSFNSRIRAQFNEQALKKVQPLANLDEIEEKVNGARKALWEEGWDRSWGKCPSMPSDFHRD